MWKRIINTSAVTRGEEHRHNPVWKPEDRWCDKHRTTLMANSGEAKVLKNRYPFTLHTIHCHWQQLMLDTRHSSSYTPTLIKRSQHLGKTEQSRRIYSPVNHFFLYICKKKKKKIQRKSASKNNANHEGWKTETNLPRKTNNFPLLHDKQRSLKCMTWESLLRDKFSD